MTFTTADNADQSRTLAEYAPPAHAYLDPLATFRAGLRAGDYDAILGEDLRRALGEAAAETGVETEIGAVRLALVRLLQEEYDPARLAVSVARLASVAVQAARVRRPPEAVPDAMQRHLIRELEAIEAERALAATAAPAPAADPAGDG